MVTHGTATGYSYYACRCDLCRSAYAEYAADPARQANRDRYRATIKGKSAHAARQRRLHNDPEELHKMRARKIVKNAVRSGKLIRLPCQVCGSTTTEAHHTDYSKPLDVTWLCTHHHKEVHRI